MICNQRLTDGKRWNREDIGSNNFATGGKDTRGCPACISQKFRQNSGFCRIFRVPSQFTCTLLQLDILGQNPCMHTEQCLLLDIQNGWCGCMGTSIMHAVFLRGFPRNCFDRNRFVFHQTKINSRFALERGQDADLLLSWLNRQISHQYQASRMLVSGPYHGIQSLVTGSHLSIGNPQNLNTQQYLPQKKGSDAQDLKSMSLSEKRQEPSFPFKLSFLGDCLNECFGEEIQSDTNSCHILKDIMTLYFQKLKHAFCKLRKRYEQVTIALHLKVQCLFTWGFYLPMMEPLHWCCNLVCGHK